MNKIEKTHPVTPRVVSNRVIISNKVFTELIDTINSIVNATNSLIDAVESLEDNLTACDNKHTSSETALGNQASELRTAINSNKDSIQALAAAIQEITNIQ